MANIASAKKQARQSARRALRNRSVRSAVKTHITRARRAIAEGPQDEAHEAAITALSSLDRATAKGILHQKNAARRKSRLMRRLNALTPASEPTADAAGRKRPAKASAGVEAKATTPKSTRGKLSASTTPSGRSSRKAKGS